MDHRAYIAERIAAEGVTAEELAEIIAVPPAPSMGDYALPCFKLAKLMRKPPAVIAQELAEKFVPDGVVASAAAAGGYLNFKLDRRALFAGFASEFMEGDISGGLPYGASDEGRGKTVCIDYSSVNIAKPFHIGHLSTTVLGGALYRIFKYLGYRVVGINHLGDYGTQFGKLISAYKRWGVREEVEKGGIHAVNDLYVRFNSEATEEMEEEARENFRLIESGDEEANRLFEWPERFSPGRYFFAPM